jgi:hypothetical protein
MLCVSPDSAGSSFGYIYLAINEHIHQEPLLAFFNNAGRAVHVLPACPDFDVFLWSNLIGMRNTLFITNLPPYIIPAGCCLLENNKFLADREPNLSWLPDFPSSPTFSGTSQTVPHMSRTVPSCPVYPLVTYHAPPTRGTYRRNPDGYDSQLINTHPPIPYAMGGPTSYRNVSPLTTIFDVSVYGGSYDTSQYGGSHHTRAHHHGTPGGGGAVTQGLLGYFFGSCISATNLFGLIKFVPISGSCQASGSPSPSQVRHHPQTRLYQQGQAVGPWHQT